MEHAPDLLSLHRLMPDQWPFLLASTAGGAALARYSLLLRAGDDEIVSHTTDDAFLTRLRHAFVRRHTPSSVTGLPFCGGWFVYLGYELAAQIEPRLRLPPANDGLPVALARRCPGALIHDHAAGQSWLVAESKQWLARMQAELAAVGERGDAAANRLATPSPDPDGLVVSADDGGQFMAGVQRIRDYIRAGDVFQVNLSRGWRARGTAAIDAADVFACLARENAAPFAGMARLPGGTVISSSPERLVEIRGRRVQTRPIAGTRPRGRDDDDDRALSAELLGHPKERAEHIMLIDLERNDLGRVCETGSVQVDELMVVESYAHVHHIVSNVGGTLADGVTPPDVIAAVFPGGTITGCPKVRCMEIIAELEQQGRGFYTGAMGYLGLDGSMDLNILIRSMRVNDNQITFRTGAGIVVDSVPAAELAETEAKARGLLVALGHG